MFMFSNINQSINSHSLSHYAFKLALLSYNSQLIEACQQTSVSACAYLAVWLLSSLPTHAGPPAAARSRQILRDPTRVANVAPGDSVNRTNYVPNYCERSGAPSAEERRAALRCALGLSALTVM